MRRPPIAYITAEYPGPSHTFILREVGALRRLGAHVCTFSIRRTRADRLLSDADREENARTFAILPCTAGQLVRAHLAALRASPGAYLTTLAAAVHRGTPGMRGRLWQLFYFAEAMIFWQQCRRLGVRRIHAHFGGVASDVAALAARFGSRCDELPWTWSLTVHGSSDLLDLDAARLTEKIASASSVMCVSDFAHGWLMSTVDSEQWNKIKVVHCGVDPEEYRPIRHSRHGGGPLRVLTVGRLVSVKGHRVLLNALEELVTAGQGVHLSIVGDGPERSALERMVTRLALEEHVTFAGAVGQDLIQQFYADADAFCLPSFFEGLPVVLMEAMAMEIPVVTTRITGIPELVEDGTNGLLVRPGRHDHLAAALARICDMDAEERAAMGRAGRVAVLQQFDIASSARQLYELFYPGVPADV